MIMRLALLTAMTLCVPTASIAGDISLEDYDGWYMGPGFSFGLALPLGDARFLADAGQEFIYSLPISLEILIEVSPWFGLTLFATQATPAIDDEPVRRTFGVDEVDALSTSMMAAGGKLRLYPLQTWPLRPYLGVGAMTVDLNVSESTNSSAGCMREEPSGECAEPYFIGDYDGWSLLGVMGLRFDIPGGWIEEADLRSKTSIIVPISLEIIYQHHLWDAVDISRRPAEGEPWEERRDARDLSLDHLTIQLGWGMLF